MSHDPPLVRLRDLLATFEPDGSLLVRSVSTGIAVQIDTYAVALIAACSAPRTRAEVIDALGEPAGDLFDQLALAGLLVAPERALETPVMFGNFAGLEAHRRMLADEVRIDAYRRALRALVRPGDTVIDAGTGTGVLAVTAALAGAQVYALEHTELARVARQVARDSGVGDRVTVLEGDFAAASIPSRARLLVTETFGAWALAEGAAPDLRSCVTRNLRADGVTVPSSFSLWLAPMPSAPPDLQQPFRRRADGVDLSCLEPEARGQAATRTVPSDAVGVPVRVGTWPLTVDVDAGEADAEIELEGPCEALCGWFVLHLAPGIDLSTAPFDPPTHWQQTVFPVSLPPGRHALQLSLSYAPEDRRTLLVEFSGAIQQTVRVH